MKTLLEELYESLSASQREVVAFDWEHTHPVLGLLRRRVENDWRITKPRIASTFYTRQQQSLIEEIFFGLLDPAWHDRIRFALSEDSSGYGHNQSLAVFGAPGETPLEIVITTRHMTLRYNTDSAEACAFGGPIFYAHEGPSKNALDPATNVFWPQAVQANQVLASLSAPLREQALVAGTLPREGEIALADSPHAAEGVAIGDMPATSQELAAEMLQMLLAPFREGDRHRVHECLRAQGGLAACRLAFYPSGNQLQEAYRCWRLQGPAFLWYFRGTPHIHVWVHVASDPHVPTNAANSYDLLGWRFPNSKFGRQKQASATGPS